MRPTADLHDALAGLLEYPCDGHAARCRALVDRVVAACPAAEDDLGPIVRLAEAGDLGACEETFVRTFDVNTERALEIGWQVFGEQYARGAFLVRMREWMREHDVAETTELPDHLTQVLRLLGRLPEEQARLLIGAVVAPSLARVRKDLDPDSPYGGVLAVVGRAVSWATADAPPAVCAGAPAPALAGGITR
jgi:nitrate reductase assembly molybdenum cofactor insertion protein NarJ